MTSTLLHLLWSHGWDVLLVLLFVGMEAFGLWMACKSEREWLEYQDERREEEEA